MSPGIVIAAALIFLGSLGLFWIADEWEAIFEESLDDLPYGDWPQVPTDFGEVEAAGGKARGAGVIDANGLGADSEHGEGL